LGSGMNRRIWSWIIAVPRFLYNFIVGDDWTVAAAVLAGLIVTGILNANHIVGWWLMPIIAIVATGVSIERSYVQSPDGERT
jgi:hypothetical protein